MPEQLAFLSCERPVEHFSVAADSYTDVTEKSVYRVVPLTYCLTGFRVPALPVAREVGPSFERHLAQVLHRFVVFLRAMHNPAIRGAWALHLIAHPERSALGAEVAIYFLARAAAESYPQAVALADRVGDYLYQLFPTEGLFNYDTPVPLTTADLRDATFQDVPDGDLHVVELRKHEDCLTADSPASRFISAEMRVDYIPHPFWTDRQLDPWLTLIETLAGMDKPALISLSLEPVTLVELDPVAILSQQFREIVDEGTRRADLLSQAAQAPQRLEDRSFLHLMSLARAYRAQGLTDFLVARARRGAHVYGQLLAWQDQLFAMRVSVAAVGPMPEALVQAVRAALSAPTPGEKGADLGWMRPAVLYPNQQADRACAIQNVRWLAHADWGASEANPKLRRLRHLVTAEEAVGMFHLPIFPLAGQTTALSTAHIPFVVPSEVASTNRFGPASASSIRSRAEDRGWVNDRDDNVARRLVSLGFVYQREKLLSPEKEGWSDSLEFRVELDDLKKPSLLVGAPGSGKSNLALYLLIQLWRDHQVPFLVLDPSTGHEYRYLYGDPSLHDDLLVYSLGDDDGLPFRFNPFDVPPDVTVRGHITRLLSCFKAAYEMWDPLPAIYEAALARLYTRVPYGWQLGEKGSTGKPVPSMADFHQSIVDHLEESVLPDYGKGTEAGGILTGASKIRVQGILNGLGHVLNVGQMPSSFFQKLLQHPVVIELGALGDPSSIALVMAFLVTQLVGHIEHAFRQGTRTERPHLLLIEEAHRLLSAEIPSTASANQGNARGKSAEEMNTMLAEVRKFEQGVMILDQRPSSLVGGVLDNALINIMCRLNDRVGFEHLSNVLNLSSVQQRHARTRLRAGDALILDAQSGQPVLMRAPNVVDVLRSARLDERAETQRMYVNARRHDLASVESLPLSSERKRAPSRVGTIWSALDTEIDPEFLDQLHKAITIENWPGARRAIRTWLTQHRGIVNPLLEQTLLVRALESAPCAVESVDGLLDIFQHSE